MPTTRSVLEKAREYGADVAGAARLTELERHGVYFDKSVLPGAESIVVLAAAHGATAIGCGDPYAGQFDTVFTYRRVEEASHLVSRRLEADGFSSLAVPPFIPLDMSEEKKGMVGMVDLRAAAALAGLGTRGESGLLVTESFGPRVRLGAVLTAAPLEATPTASRDFCDHCLDCMSACPAGALDPEGSIDRRACGRTVFRYGLREMIKFLGRFGEAAPEEMESIVRSRTVRELWQNFMTGSYYYCWECQARCGAGKED